MGEGLFVEEATFGHGLGSNAPVLHRPLVTWQLAVSLIHGDHPGELACSDFKIASCHVVLNGAAGARWEGAVSCLGSRSPALTIDGFGSWCEER